jgi:hypothetical protein
MSHTRIRSSHPINIGCHDRLKKKHPNQNKHFFFYLFILLSLCPTFLNPNLCSSFVSMMIRGRPSWHADARTSHHMFTLVGSLLGKRLKVFLSDPDEDRSDRPAIPVRLVYHRPDQFELLSNKFDSSATCTPKCFWCVTRSCINTLFDDSARDEEASIGCYGR